MAASRGPREEHEPSSVDNVRLQKTLSGTVSKQVGESNFYAKHGIKPIVDTLDHSALSSIDPESPIKMKNVRKLHDGSTKFPKLAECAHFHYDFTELGVIVVSICEDNQENFHHQAEPPPGEVVFYLTVFSNERSWVIRRTHNDFKTFDKQLHKCIFDRKFSLLPDLRRNEKEIGQDGMMALRKLLALYLRRFSSIAGNMINCGPILSWLEMDNRGNRLMVTDDSEINTPAISAGHVVKRYTGQAPDELTIQVGDIISIIDMPPGEETAWWRGKNQYQVGFFPCECVEIISDKSIPQSMEGIMPEVSAKPVLRKRGKLISFLRAFFTSRPARAQLQRTGIVKQRIFGCDLGEHLSNLGLEVPKVLTSCAIVIEEHGIVDGIYRLSGVASNIQKLRNDFDDEKEPSLTDEVYLQDIHSISSLLKAYFRELPNPLLTYQLYEKFSDAVSIEEHKLLKIHDVIQQLPPPHYRTAEYLFKHLNRVSKFGSRTGMHCKNLAIVWAPNLMRSKELESMCNTAMLQGVGVQAIVTEFLIQYADLIFSDKLQNVPNDTGSTGRRQRPKSLAVSSPAKLLSLEEAREQMLTGSSNESPKQKYIEVGGGPNNLPKDFHTVIELPSKKKSRKDRRSPALMREQSVPQGSGWKSLFSRKKQDSVKSSTSEARASAPISEPEVSKHRKLRTVRSADSLISSSKSDQGGKSKPGGKLSKDEDYPAVHPKALYPDFKKNRDTHRTMSYDLAHSESDLSDQEAMVVSMEAEMIPRPASATAELSRPQPELLSEMEHTLSVKTKVKKGKTGKELKKSKKKQRSASAGQPIEGIPTTSDMSMHSRSKSTSHTDPPPYHHTASEPTPVVGHPPPPSPSLKDRLVQALTPTSPRKRIKGPAPSPPQSPPATLTEATAKMKKSASGKSKSLPKMLPTFDQQIQKHSNTERMTEAQVAVKHSAQADQGISNRQPESTHLAQLSPIEEALHSDMSSTPDAEQQLLTTKLQHSHLQTMSASTYQATEQGSGSFGNLTDEDVFQENTGHQSSYSSSMYSTQSLGHYDYQPNQHQLVHTSEPNPEILQYSSSSAYQTDFRETEGNKLNNAEMSMSLDSLLKEMVGSDTYQSEFGSSASFRTFGKSSESNTMQGSSNKNVMPTAQQPPPQALPHDVSHDLEEDNFVAHSVKGTVLSETTYPTEGEYTTKLTDSHSLHSTEGDVTTGVIDRFSATPTNTSVLETDLDSCEDVTAETPEEFLAPEERVTVHRQDLSLSDDESGEGRHYIAPLPGDIRMMSQYPDLIPQHILPQIELQDSDVQYVDPRAEQEHVQAFTISHQQEAIERLNSHQQQVPPDVSFGTESGTRPTDYDDHFVSSPRQLEQNQQDMFYYNEPEPIVSPDIPYNHVTSKSLPTSPPHDQPDVTVSTMARNDQHIDLRSEPGHIVIRKPLEDTAEGSTFIPVKTRVVPPPRQFAYSAPPTAEPDNAMSPSDMKDMTYQQQHFDVHHHDETAIDTPSDEFPPPPECITDEAEAHMVTDGYLADRSGSTSPANTLETKDHFQARLKVAASQPVTITEEEDIAMVISPTCSLSKTPELDNAMATSSVDSDYALQDYQEYSKSQKDECALYTMHDTSNSAQNLSETTMESDLVFQMDDVKSKNSSLSKSIESLQNLSMSSEDPENTLQEGLDLVIRESEGLSKDGDQREYVIEDTQSQVGYYFTFDKAREDESAKPVEAVSQVLGKFPNISTEALVSTISVEDVNQKPEEKVSPTLKYHETAEETDKPKVVIVERLQSEEEQGISAVNKSDKKATPVRRKKSVKELLSRFEVANGGSGSSPPSDHEFGVKSKPQVFQKPRVVRLHSLNKSSDMEDSSAQETTDIVPKSPRREEPQVLMSASCPDASRMLSLSPRSIDLEEDLGTTVTLNRPHSDKPRQPPAVSKKPSVRNKIQQFESSESLTSDNEQLSKSVSPGRVVNREDSPVRPKERAFSPVPPAKPVIIHERTSPKQADYVAVKKDANEISSGKEGLKNSFPASQKSDLSPKFTRRSSGESSNDSKSPAFFQLRSASAGISNSILKEALKVPATSEQISSSSCEKKLQSLTERMRRFQSTSEEENSSSSGNNTGDVSSNTSNVTPRDSSNSMDRSLATRASGSYSNRRASVEPKQVDTGTVAENVPRNMTTNSAALSNSDQTEENRTVSSLNYTRSASVPNAFSGARLSYKSTATTSGDSGAVAMDTDESVVLKPSQLFSRKPRKSSESPSVVLSQSVVRDTEELGNKNDDDANIMSTSFSDRRKLFESSTDSRVSTSSYGSLKRSEVFVKPKQNTETNTRRNDGNNISHQEISLTPFYQGKDSSVIGSSEPAAASPRQQVDSEYTNKIRQFGNKTVVIESSENSKSKSNSTANSSHKMAGLGGQVGAGNGTFSNNRAKPYERDQKENVKPATVFKTKEKDSGLAGKERSGTVKDLWKKFEQQNT